MRLNAIMAGLSAALFTAPAFAQGLEIKGAPHDKGTGFQTAATELSRDIHFLDSMVHWIVGVIVVFVVILIGIVIVRYNAKSNPNPASFTHNTPVEIAWTVVPIIILVFIGSFSLPALFKQQEMPEGDITIKVTGYQWYWGYEYVGQDLEYEGFLLAKEDLVDNGYAESDYLLATDTAIVVPSGKTILMQVTGADVIHSWTIPAFGVKQDAVPGRIAELWFNVDEGQEGIYFGQCSELCGKDHAYMPITVKVVDQATYDAWIAAAVEDGGYIPVEEVLTN